MATNVGKGLAVIQEELHRMRMATKAQVDSLAIQREVNSRVGRISPVNAVTVCDTKQSKFGYVNLFSYLTYRSQSNNNYNLLP